MWRQGLRIKIELSVAFTNLMGIKVKLTQEVNGSLLGNDTPLLIDLKVHGGGDPFGGPGSLLLGTPSHHLGCAFYEIVPHTACKAQGLHLSSGKPLNNEFKPISS